MAATHASDALKIGDCVTFERGTIPAVGMVSELLDDDYVKVQWLDMSITTTHRSLALIRLLFAPPER
jgi:hypothetical protein